MIKRRKYSLIGLDCAHCAAKMENQIRTIPGVTLAEVNFGTGTLAIEGESEHFENILQQTKRIIAGIEPNVVVSSEGVKSSGADSGKWSERIARSENRRTLFRIGTGVLFYLAVSLFSFSPTLEVILYLLGYLFIGGDVILKAIRNIARGQVFDENFLMTLATFGALAIHEYPEAVAVMLFYQVGEFFQDLAVNRSRRSIQALLDIRPAYANLKKNNQESKVSPEEVAVGDIIMIKPGERVPLDGEILEGQGLVDTSALTGESVPKRLAPKDTILSGFINTSGVFTVQVTKAYEESTVAKILDLVQNASSRKAPTESFITKFARYYTPGVVVIATALAFLPPLLVPGARFNDWLYRALVFLVISCPCALVVSIPLSFFGGIGGASRNGVLVKGGNYLEALNNIDTVVFDKTGTLTKGVFQVTSVVPAPGLTPEKLLEKAALAEAYSGHPIAKSVLQSSGQAVAKERISSYEEIAGYGVKVVADSQTILLGSRKLLEQEGITVQEQDGLPGTLVHVAVDGQYWGYLLISDEIKKDSARALEELKKNGVKKLAMLTGDSRTVAAQVARELQLDEFYAELLPQDKVNKVEELFRGKGKGNLVFVGDGLNDAPVIARADVGVAMGGLGSDAAIEAADVVIMNDEPFKLVAAIRIARRTRNIVWQNIILALTIKGAVLIMGAAGIATMWAAVFADVGVAVLAILNAMRVLR